MSIRCYHGGRGSSRGHEGKRSGVKGFDIIAKGKMNVLNAITYFENILVQLIGHLYEHVHASEILRLVK